MIWEKKKIQYITTSWKAFCTGQRIQYKKLTAVKEASEGVESIHEVISNLPTRIKMKVPLLIWSPKQVISFNSFPIFSLFIFPANIFSLLLVFERSKKSENMYLTWCHYWCQTFPVWTGLEGLSKWEMFGDQTSSNIVWWPNMLM